MSIEVKYAVQTTQGIQKNQKKQPVFPQVTICLQQKKRYYFDHVLHPSRLN